MHQAAEHILESQPQSEHGLFVGSRASPERRGDFDGCAAFAAFGERDGIGPALIRKRLASGTLGRIER